MIRSTNYGIRTLNIAEYNDTVMMMYYTTSLHSATALLVHRFGRGGSICLAWGRFFLWVRVSVVAS